MKRRHFLLVLFLGLAVILGAVLSACGSGAVASAFSIASDGGSDATVGPPPGQLGSGGHDGGGDGGGMSGSCTPLTCAKLGYNCGTNGDGCGGQLNCGSCASPETCGGGGQFSVCGGNNNCTPKTCAQLGDNCGPVADGCGGLLQCGTCSQGFCGGGGPSVCGSGPDAGTDGGTCVPQSCASQGLQCGPAGDGCGGLLQCGTCSVPQTCGGGGQASQCGGTSGCVPSTCALLGFDCGPAGDGCGGLLQCGSCPGSELCGASQAGVCGTGQPSTDAGVYVTCEGGGTTTITGIVYAGTDPTLGFGNPDPVYNAYVYVPSGPVQTPVTGATCDQCSTPQQAIVSAITGVDGAFTLQNPPIGPSVPLVIQLGKWQRVLSVDVKACQANVLPGTTTRLPRNRTEGNIPRFAVSTGNVDVLECVLRKMGIQDSEFTDPDLNGLGIPQNPGRVHVYQTAAPYNPPEGGGAIVDIDTPFEDSLWGNQATLDSYDMVLFPCEGGEDQKPAAAQQAVINYANLGGRVFATHFSYVWMFDDAPFSGTANWTVNANSDDGPLTGIIDQSFPKGQALAQWLSNVGASATFGEIPVHVVRYDFGSVVSPSQRWMYTASPDPAGPIHFTFNTPVGAPASQQCGRVVYSDFHVEEYDPGSFDLFFPSECTPNEPLTPQERLLEFMLFDLGSCVQQDVPTCAPKTCQQLGYTCGPEGDGCGGLLECGTCSGCETCGGGGPGLCGGQCCQPKTCGQEGIQCGPAGDGCGGLLECGTCPSGESCGGGGQPGLCGAVDSGNVCVPETCASLGIGCGPAGNGCGGLLQCGTCPMGQTCGGGGQSGMCGAPTCTPKTCQELGDSCGLTGDGCGGQLNCGTCVAPATCGGGGTAGVCGGGTQ